MKIVKYASLLFLCLSARGSQRGLKLRLELVDLGLEGVGGDVVEIALHDLLAVVGNVERDFLELRALRNAHADFLEARKGTRFGVANGHRQLRLQHIEVAYIGFQRGFVEGGLLGIGGAEQKRAQQGERNGSQHSVLHCNGWEKASGLLQDHRLPSRFLRRESEETSLSELNRVAVSAARCVGQPSTPASASLRSRTISAVSALAGFDFPA